MQIVFGTGIFLKGVKKMSVIHNHYKIPVANQKDRPSKMLVGEPITDKSMYSDIIHALPGIYDKAVTNTRIDFTGIRGDTGA